MKTTKLVLLTVLLMLVLYCGAVIFVTKPDSFAYEAFFSGLQSKVEILTEEQKMIAQQEAREGISAEIQAVSSAAAEEAVTTAVNTAVSTSAQQTQSAIDAALNDYEAVVKAMVDQAVRKYIEESIPQVASAVLPEIMSHEEEFAQQLYEDYKYELANLIASYIPMPIAEPEALGEPQMPVITDMSKEEYDSIRSDIRNEEINNILNQLQD